MSENDKNEISEIKMDKLNKKESKDEAVETPSFLKPPQPKKLQSIVSNFFLQNIKTSFL